MTRRILTRRMAPLSGCLLLGLVLSGCGGSTSTATKPSLRPSPSASAAAPSPSSSPSPTVPPGTPVSIGKASLVIPPGWDVDPPKAGASEFSDPDQAITCAFGQSAGIGEDRPTKKVIDELAKERLGSHEDSARAPDLVVNGARLYHLQASDPGVIDHDDYGTVNAGYLITVNCNTGIQLMTHRKSLRKIDRVMATFRLG